jgi:hypothetical protein
MTEESGLGGQKTPRLEQRLSPKTDQDLIEWLATLNEMSFGVKGKYVKQVLRAGIRDVTDNAPNTAGAGNPAAPAVNYDSLLYEIGRIVKSAVREEIRDALKDLRLASGAASSNEDTSGEETSNPEEDDFFNHLDASTGFNQ